jgi:hypothetical protein
MGVGYSFNMAAAWAACPVLFPSYADAHFHVRMGSCINNLLPGGGDSLRKWVSPTNCYMIPVADADASI